MNVRDVSPSEAWGKIRPEIVALVTSVDEAGKANIITLGWVMRCSVNPPMVAVGINRRAYSHELISRTGEFVLAYPNSDMGDVAHFCGTHSGRDVDKFERTGLVPVKSRFVKPPCIEGCVANIECRLVSRLDTGDHTIFVGEAVAARVCDGVKPLFNFGDWKKLRGIREVT
ncbi:MAG: flavin reductase family protein [bacterium]